MREDPKIRTDVVETRGGQGIGATGVVERPRLLFFYGHTSGVCRRVEGYLAQVLQRHRNHATFRLIRIEVEEHRALADLFGIDELPTLVVLQGTQTRVRLDAPRDRPSIERALSPWLR